MSEDSYVFDLAGATTCEVASVERRADESPDDLDEVTCAVTGEGVFGDVEATVAVTNTSSEVWDYSVEVAFVRNGIRVGGGSARVENLAAGDSGPSDVFTTTDGPSDGVVCEPVSVTRRSPG